MRRTFLFGTVFAAAMAVGVGAQSGTTSQDRDSNREQNVTVTGCLKSADSWSAGSTAGSTAGTTSGSTSGSMTGSTNPSGSYGSTTASNSSGARFVLTDVSMSDKDHTGDAMSSPNPATSASGATTSASGATTSGSQTSGQPGATGTTGSFNGVNTAVWLMATGSTDNWSKYLNHRVEVKGTLTNNNPSASTYGSGSGAATTASGSTTTSGSTASGSPTGSESGATSSYGSQNQSSMATLHVTSIKEVASTCSGSQR